MIPFIIKKQLDSSKFTKYLITANTTNQFTNYGYAVQLLEKRARDMLKIDDSKAIIATSSGTSALDAILYGIEVYDKESCRVSTQAFTFPSNCLGKAQGPIITDITAHCNMNLDDEYLVKYSDTVIVTNILSKTEGRDKKLIIDNAATPYSFWDGSNSCNLGTASYISLHHTKPIGFGEGGLVIIDKKYEESVRIACNFGKHDVICNEQGGNFKMSELSAAGILQWWDQFNIDNMQHLFMKNYNKLRYEMREENGDFWFNHTSDTWFPTCLPFIRNLPVKEVSGEFKGREYKKYYKPLNNSHAISNLVYNNIMCMALTNGVDKCINI